MAKNQVSPPFETPEELIDYPVKNGDFWDQKRRADQYRMGGMNCDRRSREQAERFVKTGFSVSFVMDSKGFRSGVKHCQTTNAGIKGDSTEQR